ncbi:MAG TPA: Rpn family recombination-promoting nuclease/putative transposase [Candidatus Deferrimicrobium sp.]|nr:Rpn family recombination-promoting nuclease/putative transposase [Candidatus Deferrimicrobium sp.]
MADEKKRKKKTDEKPVEKMRSMHDEVVKDFLSENETAKSFFMEYLPSEIVRHMDFNTLKICKDSFLNKKLAKYFSDILYQVDLDGTGIFIYLLIDHKSKEEHFMGFQFLKYMLRIWELHLKQNKNAETLPVIIPIVIYHGPRKWEVDKRFIALFKAAGYIKKYIPDFKYNLYDISHVPDEEIKGAVLLRILFMTLKYIFTPELRHKLPEEIFPLFHELKDKEKGTEYLEVLLKYLTGSARNLPVDELNETVIQLFEEGGDLMATIAEKWIEVGKDQGKKEGKREGKKEGKWDVVKNSLKEGLSIKTIERITGFPAEEIHRFKEKFLHPA